jgi:hypothetical protein
MIDTSIVRVHQHGACITRNWRQSMGRSRGGLTSKIHALVDTNGLPIRLAVAPGEAHDNRLAGKLLSRLKAGSMLLPTEATTPIGSKNSPSRKALGPTSRRKAIATIRSALVHISTEPATSSNASSIRLNSVVASLRATISSPPTTSPLFSLRQSGCGSALMSPRPSSDAFGVLPARKLHITSIS